MLNLACFGESSQGWCGGWCKTPSLCPVSRALLTQQAEPESQTAEVLGKFLVTAERVAGAWLQMITLILFEQSLMK